MTPISINDPAVNVLRRIQRNCHPDAIIAGGAPRDLFLEKPIKDFDIFVPYDSNSMHPNYWCNLFGLEETDRDWMDIQAMAFFGHNNILMKNDDERAPEEMGGGYEHKRKLHQVFDIIIDRIVYQIIVINLMPKEYVEDHFDFGICKTWCDGKQFHFSGPFMHDVQNKNVTLVQKHMTVDEMVFCIEKRKPRMALKFPGYTFKVAPHLLDLYNDVQKQLK